MTEVNTHGVRMENGKHRGERITRVPLSYLRWMVREGHQQGEFARAELKRRGCDTLPDLEISGHAIDSASLRLRRTWHEERGRDQGLHAWILARAAQALRDGDRAGDRVTHLGIRFVFEFEGEWPLLKTVTAHKASRCPH